MLLTMCYPIFFNIIFPLYINSFLLPRFSHFTNVNLHYLQSSHYKCKCKQRVYNPIKLQV